MVLQKICPALVAAALVLAGGPAMATEYRADEFLGLDLSKAVLSPKPLGPATEFAPVPVQAKSDAAKVDVAKVAKSDTPKSDTLKSDTLKSDTLKSDTPKGDTPRSAISKSASASRRRAVEAAQARAEPRSAPRRGPPVAQASVEKPRGAARNRLAHRHGNPLDAQALDTRIQTWPCKSGGICDWKQ